MGAAAEKHLIKGLTKAMARPGDWGQALDDVFTHDAAIHIVHPMNTVLGPSGLQASFFAPLSASFGNLHRRDDILMGGTFDDQVWVSTHGNYVGHFQSDWLGIKATGRLEYLRFGEFFRFENGRVVEAHIYLDIPQLMIAAGQWPILDSPGRNRGYTGFIPGPATQDGLLTQPADSARSDQTLTMVEDMLKRLATKDEAWRPYWDEAMMWYGPAAFGSFVGLEEFASFQVPFEQAFELWSGGSSGNGVTRHFTRFADGDYVCSGGWPSLMCIRKDTFLGQPSQGETIFMRVCDWWRADGQKLIENWVMVDIPDVLLQMGVDLFKGFHTVQPGVRKVSAHG